MKKTIMFTLIAFLVFSFCLYAGGKQEAPAVEEGVKGPVTVSWITQNLMEPDRKDTFLQMVEMFEKQNPDIKLDLIGIQYGQINQQLQIRVAAGDAPDLIQYDATMSIPYIRMGAIADITGYFSSQEISEIPEGVYKDGIIEGKLYSIPIMVGTIGVLGWKDLLKRSGFPEKVPETWVEFKEAVRKIAALGEGTYGFGARTSRDRNSAQWFIPVLWGHLGNLVDNEGKVNFYSPQTVSALAWYREIGTTGQTPTGMNVREVRNVFGQGKIGFIFDGPWMKSILRGLSEGKAIDDDYVTGMFPKAADGKRYGIQNGNVMSVMQQSKVKEQAVRVIKFMHADEKANAMYFKQNSFAPCNKRLLSDPLYTSDPFFIPFYNSLEFARSWSSSHAMYHSALDFIAVAMNTALLGGDPDRTAKIAHDNIKTIYGQ